MCAVVRIQQDRALIRDYSGVYCSCAIIQRGKRENSALYEMSPGTDAYCITMLVFPGETLSDVQSCNCLRVHRGLLKTGG